MWEEEIQDINRRDIMKKGLMGALGVSLLAGATPAMAARLPMPDAGEFRVNITHNHTGEKYNGVYRVGSKYIPAAFEELNYILRDFRTGEVFPIDPRVIDIIYMMHQKTGSKNSLEILSGYRSPRTNEMLRRTSSGVARNSFHLTGQAIDLRLPGYRASKLQRIAINLRAGGVGYYRKSGFVHVDTGKVRSWSQRSKD